MLVCKMRALYKVIPERLPFSSPHTHSAPGILLIGGHVQRGSQLAGIHIAFGIIPDSKTNFAEVT